jgi:hypothetical protein
VRGPAHLHCRIEPRRLTALVGTALVAYLAVPAPALASSTPPQPLQPAQGATVPADTQVTFSVTAPQSESVYLSVSTSPATDSGGRIGTDQEFTSMATSSDPTIYSATPPGYTFPGWFLHAPGTYYWQASYFACDSRTFQCAYQNSPVCTHGRAAAACRDNAGAYRSHVDDSASNGSIDTKGVSGTFYFDFGPTASYGMRSGTGQASATAQGTQVYVDWTGLAPASEYHYRVVVSTSAGTSVGQDEVFFTAPLDHTDTIPSWIGRQGRGAGFQVNTTTIPTYINPSRFKNIVDRSPHRWGVRDRGSTSEVPALTRGQIDGIPEVGFSYRLPAAVLGAEIRWYAPVRVGRHLVCRGRGRSRRCHRTRGRVVRLLVDHDVALDARVPWNLGPWYPDPSQFDLESAVLHELGHFAGNPRHQPRCTDSPMVEALGPGEFWRAPNEWFEYGCSEQNARGRGAPLVGRGRDPAAAPKQFVTIVRELPPGWRLRARR